MPCNHTPTLFDEEVPTDQDREETISRLKDAYVAGALDHQDLDRLVDVALSTPNRRVLVATVGDLPGVAAPGARNGSASWRIRGAAVAAIAGVVLVAIAALGTSSEGPAQGTCISTGLSSADVDCPAPTRAQELIEQRSAVADSAAAQAHDLADGAQEGSPAADAAEAAEDAAGRARQAVAEAQAVMADSLGEEPSAGAFDQAAKDARKAARDAVQALHDVEAAVDR